MIKALFALCQIAFVPAQKPYQLGLQSSHESADFGIFLLWSLATLCQSLKWRVTYWTGVHTILDIQSWTIVLGHFCVSGVVFQFIQVQPLPSPHKQCWTRVSTIFSEFQLCIGWTEGELQENFKKSALFKEGTEKWQRNMNIAVLSQGLLSRIVHSFSCRH